MAMGSRCHGISYTTMYRRCSPTASGSGSIATSSLQDQQRRGSRASGRLRARPEEPRWPTLGPMLVHVHQVRHLHAVGAARQDHELPKHLHVGRFRRSRRLGRSLRRRSARPQQEAQPRPRQARPALRRAGDARTSASCAGRSRSSRSLPAQLQLGGQFPLQRAPGSRLRIATVWPPAASAPPAPGTYSSSGMRPSARSYSSSRSASNTRSAGAGARSGLRPERKHGAAPSARGRRTKASPSSGSRTAESRPRCRTRPSPPGRRTSPPPPWSEWPPRCWAPCMSTQPG